MDNDALQPLYEVGGWLLSLLDTVEPVWLYLSPWFGAAGCVALYLVLRYNRRGRDEDRYPKRALLRAAAVRVKYWVPLYAVSVFIGMNMLLIGYMVLRITSPRWSGASKADPWRVPGTVVDGSPDVLGIKDVVRNIVGTIDTFSSTVNDSVFTVMVVIGTINAIVVLLVKLWWMWVLSITFLLYGCGAEIRYQLNLRRQRRADTERERKEIEAYIELEVENRTEVRMRELEERIAKLTMEQVGQFTHQLALEAPMAGKWSDEELDQLDQRMRHLALYVAVNDRASAEALAEYYKIYKKPPSSPPSQQPRGSHPYDTGSSTSY